MEKWLGRSDFEGESSYGLLDIPDRRRSYRDLSKRVGDETFRIFQSLELETPRF